MSRVLNVFYGADRLPYKDQERQVHYPMVGNSFAGASLVDEIRFYAKDLGTENNVFVGIAKRPDGQRGYQVLTYGYDTELNEPYWTFNVAGWFTEKVGNVFVSLNVYQGGVDIEVDEDSGLAIVSGTPIIQATGSVVLSINYAPVMDNGYGAVPTIDVQEALSLVGSKVDTDYLTANYYNKTDVDGKLLLKADLSYVNGFVKTLEVAMDSSTYVLTFTCKDGTGTTISTQSIDLPLESVVVGGSYDSDTQSIVLTLQNGNTISIPVSDLVDGLVDTTTFETAIQGIEDELDTKANANEVYTKDEIDTLLSAKADKTTTTSLQNQINDINSRLVVVEEAIIGVDTHTFTALSYSAIPNVSDNLYPIIQSGGLDTKEIKGNSEVVNEQIIDSKPVKLISRGFNLFDGEWEVGRYDLDTGLPTVGYVGYYRSKNKIKVIGGQTYTISRTENTLGYLYEYDKNNNFLGNTYISTNTTNDFTLKQNTAYVNIALGYSLTNEPTNVCFHLTGSRTGYAPYKAPIEYPITTEVLRSAGSVQDSAVSKKIGSAKLTDLTWTARGEIVSGLYTFSATLSDAKVYPINTSVSNINISSDFGTIEPVNGVSDANATNKVFVLCTGTSTTIYVCNTTNVNPVSKSNVINYELATPAERTATLPTDIEIEKGGSLEVVYDNGYTTPADFVFDCAVYKPLE